MTTTKRPAPCAPHGVRHQAGSRAAAACADLTTVGATAPDGTHLVTVDPEQLVQVIDRDLCIVRVVFGGAHRALVADGTLGEVIADAADVRSMVKVYGGGERAAAVLTAELRLEQLAGYDHTDAIPALRCR